MRRTTCITRRARQINSIYGAADVPARATTDVKTCAIDLLEPRPGEQLLEVGTRDGRALRAISARSRGGKVIGVDPSAALIREARRRNANHITLGAIDVLRTAGASLPFPSASFDGAIGVHADCIWKSLEDFLLEVARLLKKGGRLVFAFCPRSNPVYAEGGAVEAARSVGFNIVAVCRARDEGRSFVYITATK